MRRLSITLNHSIFTCFLHHEKPTQVDHKLITIPPTKKQSPIALIYYSQNFSTVEIIMSKIGYCFGYRLDLQISNNFLPFLNTFRNLMCFFICTCKPFEAYMFYISLSREYPMLILFKPYLVQLPGFFKFYLCKWLLKFNILSHSLL